MTIVGRRGRPVSKKRHLQNGPANLDQVVVVKIGRLYPMPIYTGAIRAAHVKQSAARGIHLNHTMNPRDAGVMVPKAEVGEAGPAYKKTVMPVKNELAALMRALDDIELNAAACAILGV